MKLFTRTPVPSDHPFLMNKYTQWYYDIIHNALSRKDNPDSYVEKHHIIPDCFFVKNRSKGTRPGFIDGHSSHPNNLTVLTAREHFVCHWLLTKMVTGPLVSKMECALAAFKRQSQGQLRLTTAGQYERVRKANQTLKPDYIRRIKSTHRWWTDGDTQTFASECPGPAYKLGRSNEFKSKMLMHNRGTNNPVYGTSFWTDGIKEVKVNECPGPGWRLGRSDRMIEQLRHTANTRDSTGDRNPSYGKYWYTNGVDRVKSAVCPPGWYRPKDIPPFWHNKSQRLELQSFTKPGPGWVKGRLPGGPHGGKGLIFWTNQWGERVKSKVCPGIGWYKAAKTKDRKL